MNPGYEMTLEELKEWNKNLVNELRAEKLIAGYTDQNEITWGSREVDIINLSGVCTLIALGVVTENQTWRDLNNTDHALSTTDLVTLAGGLAYYAKLCYTNSWVHKENIEIMTDVNTLLDYDITTGWPS